MSDPKQPLFIPVVAGDLTAVSVYSAPAQPWDGVVSLRLPSAGTYSAGFAPDQSWFGAQSLNAVFQNYGMHLEALADAASFQVHVQAADAGGDRLDYAGQAGAGTSNTNAATDPPLLYPSSDGYICTQLAHKNSHVGDASLRRWSPASGKGIAGDNGAGYPDEDPTASDSGATGWAESATWPGLSAAESGRAVVLGVARGSAYVIALGVLRTVQVSANRGNTWAAGTALPTNANWAYPTCAVEFAGKWAVVDYCPTTTNVSRLLRSNNMTASSAWTTITGSVMGGDDGSTCRRMIQNSETLVMLPAGNTRFAWYEDGDAAVTSFVLTGSADPTRTGWRGAWNEQIGLFLIGNAQGDLWTSTDGKNWAQLAANDPAIAVRDIVAHGRGFVLSNSATHWAIDYLDFDRKQAYRLRRLYSARAGNTGPASSFHLAANGGRWYAARATSYSITGGGGNARYVLEWVHSDVHPWDLNNYVGR